MSPVFTKRLLDKPIYFWMDETIRKGGNKKGYAPVTESEPWVTDPTRFASHSAGPSQLNLSHL